MSEFDTKSTLKRELLAREARSLHRRTRLQTAIRGNILFAYSIALALYVAWHVLDVLEIIYVSALFAVVLMPVMRWIMKLHVGRWSPGRGMAIFLLLVAVAGAVSLFFLVALPPVIHDLREFAAEAPTRGPQLVERVRRLPFSGHADLKALNARLQDFASSAASYLFFSIGSWAGKIFDLVSGIILTIYFLLEGDLAYSWVLSFLPTDKRSRLETTLTRAEARMGKWLLGQGSLMLMLGLTSMIVFLFLHIRYAYALGVIMGLFNVIPIAGAVISMSLVVLVAAIDSWGRVVGVLIFYAIYAQVETSYLTPRIMKHSVDLVGLAVIIALMLGAALAGVVGALVAVPTAVLVTVLLNEYAVKPDPIIAEAKPLTQVERK
jgi:predicted PurR-regulated permease PerM